MYLRKLQQYAFVVESIAVFVKVSLLARLPASVLIDTYNHERFIEKAIVSVLEQDFPAADRDIIVVDDGSTDRTSEIVRRFEPRVRYIRKENGGQASAFNAGIPECRGEIIAFLDGDDYWLPGKLSRVAEVLALAMLESNRLVRKLLSPFAYHYFVICEKRVAA